MRTREKDWIDLAENRPLYGVQVYVDGKWCNTIEDGEPCIYTSKAKRDAKRAEFRKLPTPEAKPFRMPPPVAPPPAPEGE